METFLMFHRSFDITARRTAEARVDGHRLITLDVTIAGRPYRDDVLVKVGSGEPQLYIRGTLGRRCDRDIDLLQVVAPTILRAALP
jgi:hypothetical protein